MIWIILAAIGVPIWLCAVAISALVFRNRSLRKRPGDIPVRLRLEPEKRWQRGHGMWVHDVFTFRGSPAAWREALLWVGDASTALDAEPPRHLGEDPVVVRFDAGGAVIEVATRGEHREAVLGPYATAMLR